MKLSAPKMIWWIIAVFLGLVGLIANLGAVAGIAPFAFWFAAAGLVILALATLIKGM